MASIASGSLSWSSDAEIDAEADRLAVDEVMAGHVLQAIQEGVVDAVHVTGIPARVVERGAAPAMRQHQRPDAGVVDLPDVVERGVDGVELWRASATIDGSYGQRPPPCRSSWASFQS